MKKHAWKDFEVIEDSSFRRLAPKIEAPLEHGTLMKSTSVSIRQ